MVHLVYTDNTGKSGSRELDKILSGEKTMVIRGAAGRKIPHSRVFEGETLYFMEKGSLKISAKARVTNTYNHTKLTEEQSMQIITQYAEKLQLTDKQKERWCKKCLCLTEFEGIEKIEPPYEFDKQSNMDDWIILESIEDAVVGTSKPYTYEKVKL